MSVKAFMQSEKFAHAVLDMASVSGKDPKELVDVFLKTTLGTVGDTGVRAVSTLEQFINDCTDLAAGTIKGANKTTANLAKGLIRTVTFDKGAL